MATKESILNKLQILISTQFSTPEEAFAFFDEDGDKRLDRKEIVRLLKDAEINGFIRGLVASKLIEGYDTSKDEYISWAEFKAAIDEIEKDA